MFSFATVVVVDACKEIKRKLRLFFLIEQEAGGTGMDLDD